MKQYEPYFSSLYEYEDEPELVETGVTPVITYDGLGRVVRTDFPDGSYARVTRTPWLELAYDRNDTVDEAGNLWKARRLATFVPTPLLADQRALTITQPHASTPSQTHSDVMGRPFLVVAHNKVGAADELMETRTKLDIEGQVLEVKDPLGRTCQTNAYSMAGQLLKDSNIDKGARWHIGDVMGAPLRRWDDRAQVFRHSYDVLRRPTHLHMKPGAAAEVLLERMVYGDSAGTGIANPATNNLRGKAIRHFDGAGRIKAESYDFKGNSLSSDRKLATGYTGTVDWTALASITNVATLDSTAASSLESETFTETRAFDALNRITSLITPDSSEFIPTYNEASLLNAVNVKVRGATPAKNFVANIDYDAKGQREQIEYSDLGSGARFKTVYTYDPLTFRMQRLLTTRTSPSNTLQDLSYTFDPNGNIVQISDTAQQALFYDDAFVAPDQLYWYDAVYRLVEARGREHKSIGDVMVDHNDQPIRNLPLPTDPSAVRNYTETYDYDLVGNVLEMFHSAGAATWTRAYTYTGGTNRLASNSGGATYSYDLHGSMNSMPHLSTITYTPFDQMKSADKGGGGMVYFTYDASGQRVRKVWEQTASVKKERIYLGAYEIYRERLSGVIDLERQTLHVNDGAQRIAMVETKTIASSAPVGTPVPMYRYQLTNHLGSAMLEVDETGLVISFEEYTPYGASAYRAARSSVDVSARRYRYAGKERDDETGLYYNGARYLAAWLGRWTSADPIGMQAGVNLYQYCRGSPINYTDPTGTTPLFMGSRSGGSLWKSPAGRPFIAAARAFETVSKWKAEKVAEERAGIEERVAEAGGGVGAQIHGGGQKVLLSAFTAVLYAPGTFYDAVASIKGSYDRGGPAKVLEDVVSAPKREFNRAHEAADSGDWGGFFEHAVGGVLDVAGAVTGAFGIGARMPRTGPPTGPQPALAGAGAATAEGTLSVPVVGGATDAALGGLLSMMGGADDEGDPEAPEADDAPFEVVMSDPKNPATQILEGRIGGHKITIMADIERVGDTITLKAAHVEGPGPGKIGIGPMQNAIKQWGKSQGVKQVVIEGAARTTGAGNQRAAVPRPWPIKVE